MVSNIWGHKWARFAKRYADPTKLFEILFQCMKQEMALGFVGAGICRAQRVRIANLFSN